MRKPLHPIALALLVMGVGVFGSNGASATSLCVDEKGIWLLPDGLVLGGPRDNSFLSQYAGWIANCGFVVEPRLEVVEQPYEEVLLRWETCLAAFAREKQHQETETILASVAPGASVEPFPPVEEQVYDALDSGPLAALTSGVVQLSHNTVLPPVLGPVEQATDTPLLDPLGDGAGLVEQEAEEATASAEAVLECGPGPDADDVLPNGNLRFEVPMVHVGSHDGSIQYASYSQKADGSSAGRINVVYWNKGEVTAAYNKLVSTTHWNYADCGGDRWAWVYDGMHIGGTNTLWKQTHQSEAHRNGWYTPCASDTRYHMRHFGRYLHDTHYGSGSFGEYSIANVHWEEYPHEDTADSEKGQKPELYSHRYEFSIASSELYNPFTGEYEYFYKLA